MPLSPPLFSLKILQSCSSCRDFEAEGERGAHSRVQSEKRVGDWAESSGRRTADWERMVNSGLGELLAH